jgi:hypothetical protein
LGLLSDGPATRRGPGGVGAKFIRLYKSMDEADRALIRHWVERGESYQYVADKLSEHYDIGYSSVERGLWRLVESEWES